MRLVIENIGKVGHADIELENIAVIAAPNNSGKSTIGKALYSLVMPFKTFNDDVLINLAFAIDQRVCHAIEEFDDKFSQPAVRWAFRYGQDLAHSDRNRFSAGNEQWIRNPADCSPLSRRMVEELTVPGYAVHPNEIYGYFQTLAFTAQEDEIGKDLPDDRAERKRRILRSSEKSREAEVAKGLLGLRESDLDKVLMEIAATLSTPREELAVTLSQQSFDQTFNGQISGRYRMANGRSRIAVWNENDANPMRSIRFNEDACVVSQPARNEPRNVYILDDPSIMASLGSGGRLRPISWRGCFAYRGTLQRKLIVETRKDIHVGERLVEESESRKRLGKIEALIDQAVPLRIILSSNGLAFSSEDNPSEGISFANASMGVSAFALMRLIVEHDVVREGDVLVLDEPEIHLHPSWQTIYAHLVVLMAKELGIKMIITTHSPYFMKAIATYAYIEGYDDGVRYYTSAQGKNGATAYEGDAPQMSEEQVRFYEVRDGELNKLYEDMAQPLRDLDEQLFNSALRQQ